MTTTIEAEPVRLGRDGLPVSRIKIHRKQAEVLSARERFLVLPWGRRSGKALQLDTRLPTPTGWTTVDAAKIGDQLFDENGQVCRIVDAFDVVPERAYRLTFTDGTSIECGGEHLWATWTHAERKALMRSSRANGNRQAKRDKPSEFPQDWPKWRSEYVPPTRDRIGRIIYGRTKSGPKIRSTDEIVATLTYGKRMDTNHCIPLSLPLEISDSDLPIDPGILGIWLGDGTSANGGITCSIEDRPELLGRLSMAGYSFKVGAGLRVGVHGLGPALRAIGLIRNKHVPVAYLRGSIQQRLSLLRGLMDSDGHASKSNTVEFCNTNKRLADAVTELARSLGERPVCRESRAKLYGRDISAKWRVTWRPSIHNPFLLKRKADAVKPLAGHSLQFRHRMIIKAEPIPVAPMRCFRVDSPNHLFLAGEAMVPTHNSEVGVLWTLTQAQRLRSQGVKGVAWVVTPAYLHAVSIWRKIHRLAPPGWITSFTGNENMPGNITFGSVRIEFRSAAKPERLVSEGLLFAWIDEAAIIPERTWGESIRPTLMDRAAPAFFSGSPKGGGNWFHQLYLQGWDTDPQYSHIRSFGKDRKFGFSSHVNPFIVQGELELMISDMTERMYRQEIMAEFLTGEGAVFRRIREQVMVKDNQKHHADRDGIIRPGWESVGKTVVLGIDLARFKDWSVIVGLDKNARVSYFDRFNQIDYPLQKARIMAAYHKLGKPQIVLDSTHGSVGDPIQQDLVAAGIRVHPFTFTSVSKAPMIESLILALEKGELWLPDEPIMINELEIFDGHMRESGRMFYSAPKGKHDDVVAALGMALWGLKKVSNSGIVFAPR